MKPKNPNYKIDKLSYKNGYKIISTKEGKFLLKDRKEESIYDYLNSRGFNNYPRLLNRADKYNIYEYQEDKTEKNDKAIDLVYLMSMLHTKTTTYQETNINKVKKIYEEIVEELDYLNIYYHKLQDYVEEKIYASPAEYLFIRNASSIYEIINIRRNYLEKWYEEKSKLKRERVVLINNNLSLQNYSKQEEDKIIDWSKARKDWVSYDFYSFYLNNYKEVEMNSLFEIYQRKYPFTLEEKYLFYTLICKIEKKDFKKTNYINNLEFQNMINYIEKTKNFILEENKEDEKTDKEKLEQ